MHWIIWEWAEKKGIRSAASHILGEKNTEAGRESRKLFVDLEWMLCSKSLSKAVVLLNYAANVDLLPSNANHQFHTCYSCKPYPEAPGVDSLTADWNSLRFYVFPPFSIIWRKVLKKIKVEDAEDILVAPFWLNQPRFPLIFKMLTDAPILLISRKNLLHLPQHPQTLHLIWRKVDLLACHLAGSSQKTAGYLSSEEATGIIEASWRSEGKDIRATCTNSPSIAYKRILIPLKQISK